MKGFELVLVTIVSSMFVIISFVVASSDAKYGAWSPPIFSNFDIKYSSSFRTPHLIPHAPHFRRKAACLVYAFNECKGLNTFIAYDICQVNMYTQCMKHKFIHTWRRSWSFLFSHSPYLYTQCICAWIYFLFV